MAKLISQWCGELQPAVCLSRDMEPFEGDLSTHRCTTSLENKPQQKYPGQLSASVPAWIFSQCVLLSFDGEKCVLLLNVWKPAFLKSGHICSLFINQVYISLRPTFTWFFKSFFYKGSWYGVTYSFTKYK